MSIFMWFQTKPREKRIVIYRSLQRLIDDDQCISSGLNGRLNFRFDRFTTVHNRVAMENSSLNLPPRPRRISKTRLNNIGTRNSVKPVGDQQSREYDHAQTPVKFAAGARQEHQR